MTQHGPNRSLSSPPAHQRKERRDKVDLQHWRPRRGRHMFHGFSSRGAFRADDWRLFRHRTEGPVTEKRSTPLCQRMIDDMDSCGLCVTTQIGRIRCVKHFAAFPWRTPDTATPGDLRACQLQRTTDGVSATTFSARVISLRQWVPPGRIVRVVCRSTTDRTPPFHADGSPMPPVQARAGRPGSRCSRRSSATALSG